jgi:hypothetical protein
MREDIFTSRTGVVGVMCPLLSPRQLRKTFMNEAEFLGDTLRLLT